MERNVKMHILRSERTSSENGLSKIKHSVDLLDRSSFELPKFPKLSNKNINIYNHSRVGPQTTPWLGKETFEKLRIQKFQNVKEPLVSPKPKTKDVDSYNQTSFGSRKNLHRRNISDHILKIYN